jgi:hypothetical protein
MFLLLLASCTTTNKPFTVDHNVVEIAKLKQTDIRLSYLIEDNMCHIQYGVCLGEKKKTDKQCAATKEQCIVNVYEQWKKLLE